VNISETLAVNQLLGRLAYFHALFVESALPPTRPDPTASHGPCCHHALGERVDQADVDVSATAWAVLLEIGANLGTDLCCLHTTACCPTCRIQSCSAAVSGLWIASEAHAYRWDQPPTAHTRQEWQATISAHMTAAFARQYGTHCTRTTTPAVSTATPTDRFPLTGELAALWSAPTSAAPVISWLNHCASIAEIAQHLCTGSAS